MRYPRDPAGIDPLVRDFPDCIITGPVLPHGGDEGRLRTETVQVDCEVQRGAAESGILFKHIKQDFAEDENVQSRFHHVFP